jgi:predicted dehydrogenase
MPSPPLRCAAIGLNHPHIYDMLLPLLEAGVDLAAFHAEEDDLAAAFARRFPQARRADEVGRILEDETIAIVVSAIIPDRRAALAMTAMRHGKDVMVDKPGVITLEDLAALRRVQAETGRIFSVCFSERFQVRASVKAGELVQAGAIGRVVHTVGLGPHRLGLNPRPAWFFERARYGGILVDIAAHQADQFLYFTGSTEAEVVAAHIANYANPATPELEDFGEMMLRGNRGTGYVRVDWYTPDGLGVWGDGRTIILGTEGYIEARKYIDIAGRPGADHLFLVDKTGTRRIDCDATPLPYAASFVADVLARSETAMRQDHCFLACELALEAEAMATRLDPAAD